MKHFIHEDFLLNSETGRELTPGCLRSKIKSGRFMLRTPGRTSLQLTWKNASFFGNCFKASTGCPPHHDMPG